MNQLHERECYVPNLVVAIIFPIQIPTLGRMADMHVKSVPNLLDNRLFPAGYAWEAWDWALANGGVTTEAHVRLSVLLLVFLAILKHPCPKCLSLKEARDVTGHVQSRLGHVRKIQ